MEIKKTKYYIYTCEYAYDCPYCDTAQGWTGSIDDEDFEETYFCNKCRKEFKLVK